MIPDLMPKLKTKQRRGGVRFEPGRKFSNPIHASCVLPTSHNPPPPPAFPPIAVSHRDLREKEDEVRNPSGRRRGNRGHYRRAPVAGVGGGRTRWRWRSGGRRSNSGARLKAMGRQKLGLGSEIEGDEEKEPDLRWRRFSPPWIRPDWAEISTSRCHPNAPTGRTGKFYHRVSFPWESPGIPAGINVPKQALIVFVDNCFLFLFWSNGRRSYPYALKDKVSSIIQNQNRKRDILSMSHATSKQRRKSKIKN